MEILNEFGFKIELFVAQVINFLILAYVFKRFLYKPLLTVLKKRQTTIQKGLKDAEEATIQLEEAEKKRDEILKKTRSDAEDILSDAKKMADEIRTKAREQTKAEVDKMILDAKAQAAEEMTKVESQLKKMSLDVSIQLLSKVTSNIFTHEEKEKILKRTVEKLEKN